jgi:hypothetical protein
VLEIISGVFISSAMRLIVKAAPAASAADSPPPDTHKGLETDRQADEEPVDDRAAIDANIVFLVMGLLFDLFRSQG